jgi:hypothetical protein
MLAGEAKLLVLPMGRLAILLAEGPPDPAHQDIDVYWLSLRMRYLPVSHVEVRVRWHRYRSAILGWDNLKAVRVLLCWLDSAWPIVNKDYFHLLMPLP